MILESKNIPIIAEIKSASPSLGAIREKINPTEIAKAMEKGGAIAISVLTEPKRFKGSISSIPKVREVVKLPVLMKDVIISPVQLEAASRIGANAVLLIEALFERKYCECDIDDMIAQAHSMNLEVLLEAHNESEFRSAINRNIDLVGINNRDLGNLKVDLGVTRRILEKENAHRKIIVSESGIQTPADVRFLNQCGAHAFLIGTTIMLADNVEKKVKEFVMAV